MRLVNTCRAGLTVVVGVVALVVCDALHASALSAQGVKNGRPCTPEVVDSTRYAVSPLYRNCDVDTPAKLKREGSPTYRFPQGIRCGIVELTFLVDTTGRVVPGSSSLIMFNDDRYAEVVVKDLKSWRYEPATLAGRPVTQLVFARHARKDDRVPFVVGGNPVPPPPPPCR